MQCNGKEILWQHLKNLYQSDGGAMRDAAGLAMVPKLKYEHVNLTSFSKMRVDLAAQVHAQELSIWDFCMGARGGTIVSQ